MNNRQSGRRRGRSNSSNSNPRQSGQGRNNDQGNRIDNRARGNATQLLEKYRNMARDAQLSSDRVMMEYYLQFADHYFRVLSDARSRQDEQRSRFDEGGDSREDPQDDDDGANDGDELDAIDLIGRAPRNRDGQRDGQRDRDNRNGRSEVRNERPNDRPNGRSADGDRPEREHIGREHIGREHVGREHIGREQPARDRPERDQPRRTAQSGDSEINYPRRPRRDFNDRGSNADGDVPLSIDVAVLPPAIGIEPAREAVATAEAGAPAAPKRRGRPRKAETEGEVSPA